MTNVNRQVPLVLLAVSEPGACQPFAALMRSEGVSVAVAHGDQACLRMATALYPDVILLDPRLPRALLSLLRAHPLSKHAQISWARALAGFPAAVNNR